MKITHLFISPAHNFYGHHGKPPGDAPILELEEVECVAGKGLAGDRFFGWKEGYKGQATFFAQEVHEGLCARFGTPGLPPSIYRRNIITQGVDLNSLIGQEFEVQGIRFLGTEECRPCYWMDQALAPGAEAAMRGNGGLRVRILSDGILRRG